MTALKRPEDIREAYAESSTAEEYIDVRFTSAWGSVLHATQLGVINGVIRDHAVQRVLEIAPGPARLSAEVSGFTRGYLCEFNESMLQVARRRLTAHGPWRLIRGDAFRLPLRASAALDLVYTFRFIRHFEAADRATLYRQARAVLKDGGLLVFDAVNARVQRTTTDDYPIYDVLYEQDALRRELVEHGFEPVSFVPVIRHMWLQSRIQILVAPRSTALARFLISALECLPGEPLEWIVVCRQTPTSAPATLETPGPSTTSTRH